MTAELRTEPEGAARSLLETYLKDAVAGLDDETVELVNELGAERVIAEAADRPEPVWRELLDVEAQGQQLTPKSTDPVAAWTRRMLGAWPVELGAWPVVIAWVVVCAAFAATVFPPSNLNLDPLNPDGVVRLLLLVVPLLVATQAVRFVGEARLSLEALGDERREEFRLRAAVPELRAAADRLLGTRFSRPRGSLQADGLRELVDPTLEVSLPAQKELERITTELRSGSLGIAGSRGAGKTTLITAAASGRTQGFGVTVSAPVSYEARDFVSYLFGRLCVRVLGPRVAQDRVQAARDARMQAAALTAAVLLMLLELMLAAYTVAGSGDAPVGTGFLVVAVVSLGVAALATSMLPRVARQRRRRGESPLIEAAWANLDRLRYLETQTQEWSSELSAKGAKFGAKRGFSRAAQALTLPELIDAYDNFVRLASADGPVFIGIDELDKMKSAEELERFLNGIKALLGQPQVFYLVSISDDALRAFEQRGLPVRDAFESVFDDVLFVEPAKLEGSEILRRRVGRLSTPFVALCHVMSGGLPRELIRCAREVAFEQADDDDIADVALSLVARRSTTRQRAAEVIARRHVAADGTQPMLNWLRTMRPPTGSVALLVRAEVSSLLGDLDGLTRMDLAAIHELRLTALELAANWYHGATIVEFFTILDEHAFKHACDNKDIEVLARATLDLGLAPALAWESVSAFRRAVELQVVDYPASVSPPAA